MRTAVFFFFNTRVKVLNMNHLKKYSGDKTSFIFLFNKHLNNNDEIIPV